MSSLMQSMDSRRLAMLKVMGVELWWTKGPNVPAAAPAAAPVGTPASVGIQGATQQAVHPTTAQPAAAEVANAPAVPANSPAQKAPLSPSVMQEHIVQTALTAVTTTRAPSSSMAAAVSVVWSAPVRWNAEADAAKAQATSSLLLLVDDLAVLGEAQPAAMQLLGNMVRAMGLAQSPSVWVSWASRQEASDENRQTLTPAPADLIAQTSPTAVLVMGRDAAQQWLGRTEPLGALRQTPHDAHGQSTVVTFSPAYLLRATHAKRQAWDDLQRAMALLNTGTKRS